MRMPLRRPSPAMVVACLALFVSLTGTGVAVTNALPHNSVGTAQLKNGAVVSSKVKDGSLRSADFAPEQLPQGETGPAGPAGPVGPKGDKGDPGASAATKVDWKHASGPQANPGGISTANLACPADEHAIAGGAFWTATGGGAGAVVYSSPYGLGGTPAGWVVAVKNVAAGGTVSAAVHVICVSP
jgi:hypothetical protein